MSHRAELKKQLLAQAEITIEQFLDWIEQTPAPTLTQIVDAVLRYRKHLGQQPGGDGDSVPRGRQGCA